MTARAPHKVWELEFGANKVALGARFVAGFSRRPLGRHRRRIESHRDRFRSIVGNGVSPRGACEPIERPCMQPEVEPWVAAATRAGASARNSAAQEGQPSTAAAPIARARHSNPG